MEAMMVQGMDNMSGNMASLQDEMLAELVNEGTITQAQVDAFGDIHDRLLETGLMQ